MERILVLMRAASEAEIADAEDEAFARAAEPGRLSFLWAEDPWQAADWAWQGENWMLIVPATVRFGKGWDRRLLRSLRRCGQTGSHTVLTGYLPRDFDVVHAVSPVAAECFDEDGFLRFHRGTALRYAVRPERCAFLHPDFAFAPAGFFRECLRMEADTEGIQPLWLTALALRYPLFTLDDPALRLTADDPIPPCPSPERTETLLRFEAHFGVDFAARTLDAKAQVGVYSADLSTEVRVPLSVRMQEGLRRADQWLLPPKVRPMLVTCWMTLPEMQEVRSPMMASFRRLAAMKHITLTCFADGRSARQLVLTHPNVLEFKQRHALPTSERITAANALNYIRLSKPFLLQQAKDVYHGHTHYVWINFDYLRYPVYEGAALDWETICGGKITLAVVNGQPDLSMIAVPTGRLEALCREVERLCAASVSQGLGLPDETALWQRLLTEHPGWFQTYELPGWRELFSLTMTTKEEEWGSR